MLADALTYDPGTDRVTLTDKVSAVILQRRVGGGAAAALRRVEYAYYAAGDANETRGDLKSATTTDPAGTATSTAYYRYYLGGEAALGGFRGVLKAVFNPAAFARLAGQFSTPYSAADDNGDN